MKGWAWEDEAVITGVTALPGHRLRIELRTGSVLELNMANRLDGGYLLFGSAPDFELKLSVRMAVLMALNQPGHTVSGVDDPFPAGEICTT